jgi:hypothetical protein
VRQSIDAELAGVHRPAPPRLVEQLSAFRARRHDVVETLATRCSEQARVHGVELVFIDLAAGMSGWADGRSTGPLGVHRARDLGIDICALSRQMTVAPAVYTASSDRFREELSAYRRLGVDGPLIIRAGAPDVTTLAEWLRRLAELTSSGVQEIGLYQYRFLSAGELRRVAETLGSAASGRAREPWWAR